MLYNSDIPSIVVRDDSGHWYVINESALYDFLAWCGCMENDEDSTHDFEPLRIDGLHNLRIFKYELK